MDTNGVMSVATGFQEKMEGVKEFVLEHVQDSHHLILPYKEFTLSSSLSMHRCMILLASALLIVLFGIVYRRKDAVPRGITNFLEMLVVFVRDEISIKYLGEKDGRKMAPLFCSFFFFILMLNLLGLVPSFAAATGATSVTLALASVTFCFMVFGGIVKTGLVGFLKGLIPSGVPVPVAIFLFPLEVVSIAIKTGALTIRLFANMFAGHMALFLLVGMLVLFGVLALPVVLLVMFVYVLEIFVAVLQAYIFTLLSAIFIGQRYHPEH